MTATKQELADEIASSGLNTASLEAILKALRTVAETGYGTLNFEVKKGQIADWYVKVTGKSDKVLTTDAKFSNLYPRKK